VGVLNEVIAYTDFGKTGSVPGFQEKATLIFEVVDVDYEKIFKRRSGGMNVHFGCAS
jgi:hypothetical protein